MWILPKTLTQSSGSLAMAETISDSNEQSRICALSLLVRSKHSPLRTWSAKWKRDSWTQHLSGRIARPSPANHLLIESTFSLLPILANHFPPPESGREQTTSVTCGPTSYDGYGQRDLFASSSKTSKDTFRWDSPQSSAIWKKRVIAARGAYSARLKSAHRTSASGCSSWPTATARCWKDTVGCSLDATNPDGSHRNRRDRLVGAIAAELYGPPGAASSSTDGSRQELWLTPRANEPDNDANFAARNGDRGMHCHGSLSSQVKQWATPAAFDWNVPETLEAWQKRADKQKEQGVNLHRPLKSQVVHEAEKTQQWPTPTPWQQEESQESWEARKAKNKAKGYNGNGQGTPLDMMVKTQTGKLNFRWVEALMGLPVGWVMPSCASPVTIERTNCDCSETESCQQQQSEPGACCGQGSTEEAGSE
jgi:hypothetical protein